MHNSFTRKVLVSAILATLPITASAAGFDGFISGSADINTMEGESSNTSNGNELAFRGSLAYDFGNNIGLQGDFVHSSNDFDVEADGGPFENQSGTRKTTDMALHAYYGKSNWRLGAIAQYRTHDIDIDATDPSADIYGDASADLLSPDEMMLGLEGQAFFGDFDVSGQVGKTEWDDIDVSSDINVDGTFATLEAGYLIQDNWKVGASISQMKLDFNGEDLNQKAYALNTEYRLADSPVSFFANYTQTNQDAENGGNTDGSSLMAGIKVSFGGTKTLRETSRSGASLNPVRQFAPLGEMIFRDNTSFID